MTYIKSFTDNYETVVPYLSEKIIEELKTAYPEMNMSNELPASMINVAEITGNKFISKGYAGLTKTIAELIGGIEAEVNTNGFANDLVTFKGRDDVLTLLVHLGYLAYDESKKTVRIPNEEIRMEFARSVREVSHAETMNRVAESDKLMYDTIHMDEEAVAAQIEKIHFEETSEDSRELWRRYTFGRDKL